MRRHIIASCLALFSAFPAAHAGAWLREQGKAFSALSFTLNPDQNPTTSLYLDFGLSPETTIGADLTLGQAATGGTNGSFLLFLRRPLGASDTGYRLAYEIGLGAGWQDGETTPQIKTMLSWGRGVQIADRSGWATLDASHLFQLGTLPDTTKLDATLGLNFSEHISGMMQFFLSHSDGTTSASITSSVIFKRAQSKARYQLGLEHSLTDGNGTALKFGLWRDF